MMSRDQQQAVWGAVVVVFALLGVGSFFGAIWTHGALSERIAGTGFVCLLIALVVYAWRDVR